MNTLLSPYELVMTNLRAKRIPQKEVAEGSGVPFSTVTKIAQGRTKSPGVHTVEALANYFMRVAEKAAAENAGE